jgi:hypothetical protein
MVATRGIFQKFKFFFVFLILRPRHGHQVVPGNLGSRPPGGHQVDFSKFQKKIGLKPTWWPPSGLFKVSKKNWLKTHLVATKWTFQSFKKKLA